MAIERFFKLLHHQFQVNYICKDKSGIFQDKCRCRILYALFKLIIKKLFNYCRVNYYITKISLSMAAAFIKTAQIKVFDRCIFTIITNLKREISAQT